MRTAGCIINDVIDKKYDSKVERTKNRPYRNWQVKFLKLL